MKPFKFVLLIMTFNFFSCQSSKDLPTVNKVNLDKYKGLWYEIARLPNRFEKELVCVTANYRLQKNGKIEVINQGFSIKKNEYKSAKGVAWVPDKNYQGRLKVSFFWPFSGNYYIISLDKDYNYVLVGDPSRKYLWVLARTKKIDDSIYNKLLNTAKTNGFDIQKIIKIQQDCN